VSLLEHSLGRPASSADLTVIWPEKRNVGGFRKHVCRCGRRMSRVELDGGEGMPYCGVMVVS